MKILCSFDGIYINNIDYNEVAKEYIFGIDENNKIIKNISFLGNISITENDQMKFDSKIRDCNNEYLDNGYLFYSFCYELSFPHYFTQTLPKLYQYINMYNNYTLLIPEFRYNELCKDILKYLNIDESRLKILKDNTMYHINDYIKTISYEAVPGKITYDHLWIYNKLREPLNIQPNINPSRKIYLKRDNCMNNEFGNLECGIKRQIYNEEELIQVLITFGFEIITLGNKYLKEKSELLSNASILITPLGGNCLNLILSNSPKNILYLSNSVFFGDDYYNSLTEILNHTKITHKTLRYNGYITDPMNRWNCSFYVNIDDVVNYIIELNH